MGHPVDAYINININGQLYTIINASTRCYTRTVYIWKNKKNNNNFGLMLKKYRFTFLSLFSSPGLSSATN